MTQLLLAQPQQVLQQQLEGYFLVVIQVQQVLQIVQEQQVQQLPKLLVQRA